MPDARRRGVRFPANLTALWAEALCDLETTVARIRAERDQLLVIARDADLIAGARKNGPTPATSATIIDLSAIFAREQLARRQHDGGAA